MPFKISAQSKDMDSLRMIIAQELKDTNQVNSHIRLAQRLIKYRQLEEGLTQIQESIELSKKLDYEKGIINAYSTLASYHADKNNFQQADSIYQMVLYYAHNKNNQKAIMTTLNSIGLNHYNIGNYDQALDFHIQAYKMAELQKDFSAAAKYASNISRVYSIYDDYINAIKYIDLAIAFERKINGPLDNIIIRQINLSNYLIEDQKFERGIAILKEALNTNETVVKNEVWEAYIRNNLGQAYVKSGKTKEGVSEFLRAKIIFEELKDPFTTSMICTNLAHAYTQLKQHRQAAVFLKESFTWISDEDLDPDTKRYRSEVAAYVYENNGEYQLALQYYKNAQVFRDSIFRAEQFDKVAELREKFETGKKEDSLRYSQDELVQQRLVQRQLETNTMQKNWLLILSMILILVLSGAIIYAYGNAKRKKEANRILNEQNEIIRQKNAENELLLAEIHHRVKNNLQVISSLLSLQGKSIVDENAKSAVEAGKLRVKSMELVHTLLYEGSNFSYIEMHAFTGKLINNLAQVYGVTEGHFQQEINIPEIKLDVDSAMPIALLLNEVIVNSFKHSYLHSEKPFIISVDLKETNHKLFLRVSDNGKGSDVDQLKTSNSFGFKLIQLLTRQLNGEFEIFNEEGLVYGFQFNDYKRIV